jgi:hypothetical protein
MKIVIAAVLLAATAVAQAQTYVPGYIKQDGTFVQGHTRSAPNSTRIDNYGAKDNIYGNQNPYTGERGSQRSELSSNPGYNQPQRQRQCFQDIYGRTQCQ